LLEGAEAFHLDGRKMSEHIRTSVGRLYEAKTFSVIEPLDSTDSHFRVPPGVFAAVQQIFLGALSSCQ
jgi:hypothetical protein